MLAPLEKDDQSLMKLDAIFAALHVENEDDIYRLATYFSTQNSPAITTKDERKSPMLDEAGAVVKGEDTLDVSAVFLLI